MDSFEIKPMSLTDVQTAVGWAEDEGWNPGVSDAEAFFATDPEGFLMGFLDDEPVSSISCVRYPEWFGFVGFYIVRPEFRGQGFGLQTWNRGLALLDGATVGLDGVPDQRANYEKSGFVLSHQNIRYSGSAGNSEAIFHCRPLTDWGKLKPLDRECFPSSRDAFLRSWTSLYDTHVYERDGEVLGYGTIRPCGFGYKIGPLFARSADVAAALYVSLTVELTAETPVSLDVCSTNAAAVAMAEQFGLQPSFRTARMYLGPAPVIDWSKVYGITTFELG